ncbi:MAG: hypothetical protein JW741_19185 [Sedimentisphaerales bacterium]|nr:hypothetical protein [Sedimentisphaerales bacterium]
MQVEPEVRHQTWQGFGEGGMDQFIPTWHEQYTQAQRDAWLDRMYTLDDNGLGLNICRFLMPVGDAPGHHHSFRLPKGANRPFEPEPNVFNWEGHENILWHLEGAKQRGALTWASWYAVPYWLTVSGCSAGSVDGATDNLVAGKEARFVQHIVDVMKHFRSAWGVDFDYVSAINEPDADWWKAGGGQPGCHVSAEQAIVIYTELARAMDLAGFRAKRIAFDAGYTNGTAYLDVLLASPIVEDLSVLACHQYITTDEALKGWASRGAKHKKDLWMTEWGDWANDGYPDDKPHAQALNYANKIHEAMTLLEATGWVIWEPAFIIDEEPTGLLPRKSFWAVAQYSRHVRPGMVRVDVAVSGPLKATAWLSRADGADRKLAVIMVNDGDAVVTAEIELPRLPGLVIDEIRRTCDADDYALISVPAGSAKGLVRVTLPAGSIVTVAGSVVPGASVVRNAGTDVKVNP